MILLIPNTFITSNTDVYRRRYLHGIHLPHDGRHYLLRRPPRCSDPDVEATKHDRGHNLPNPRTHQLPNRLARHRQETVRRSLRQ